MSKDSSELEKKPSSNGLSIKSRWKSAKQHTPPKNFGSPVRVVATTLIIFLFSQVLATVLVGLFYAIANPDNHLQTFQDSPVAEFFYILLAEVLAIWFVFRVIKRRGLKLGTIGLGRRPKLNDVGLAFFGFIVFYAILIAIGLLLNEINPDLFKDEEQDVGFNNLTVPYHQLLALVALVVFPPLGEEILIRGYLYSGLRAIWRFVPALIATSVIFALAHLQPGNDTGLIWGAALNTFFLSVVLIFLRERSGALYAGILLHAVNNLIAFSVHFRAVIF